METIDLVRYVIKKYPLPEELSKARLNKIIYLIDWKSAIEKQRQLTNIHWLFNHYGPYVREIESLIIEDPRFKIEQTTNFYGGEKNIITLKDDQSFIEPSNEEKIIIEFIMEKTRRLYWDKFINLVYSTYPIISQAKGSNLDLVQLAKEYKELKESN